MISRDSVPRLASGCRLHEGEGRSDLLLFPEGVLRMNPASLQIVRRCDGKRNISSIVDELQSAFSSEKRSRLESDVTELIGRLHGKGLIDLI